MEIFLIVLTASLTLIGGVILLIVGRAVEVLIVSPLQRYKQAVQVALERMNFYANRLTNFFSDEPDDEERQLKRTINEELRVAATTLESSYLGISSRKVLVRLKLIPSNDDLRTAYGQLILLSNNLPMPERERGRKPEQSQIDVNHKAMEAIKERLGK